MQTHRRFSFIRCVGAVAFLAVLAISAANAGTIPPPLNGYLITDIQTDSGEAVFVNALTSTHSSILRRSPLGEWSVLLDSQETGCAACRFNAFRLLDDQTMLVASQKGLYRSENAGTSWVRVLEADGDFIGEGDEGELLLCTYPDKFYLSLDRGLTWTTHTLAPEFILWQATGNGFGEWIGFGQHATDEFPVMHEGIFRANDVMTSWTAVYMDDQFAIFRFMLASERHGLFGSRGAMAVEGSSVIRSTNGGTQWEEVQSDQDFTMAMAEGPNQQLYLLKGHFNGKLFTSGDGVSWQPMLDSQAIDPEAGPSGITVSTLHVSKNNHIYIGALYGLYRFPGFNAARGTWTWYE